MPLRVTLNDIARHLGLAKSTVSMALRNDRGIAEETRQSVQAAAAELGYRPDPALARIAAHRWHAHDTHAGSVIAFVTTRHPSRGLLDRKAIAGAREQAERLGYRLEHFPMEEHGDAARLGQVIYNRGIRSVIVGQVTRDDFCAQFPWHWFAATACNTGFYRPPVNMVAADHAHAVKRACQEAFNRGYRRIGLVLFDELHALDYFDKVSAFLFFQASLPRSLPRIRVLHVRPSDPSPLPPWFRKHRPDCVLGANIEVLHWLTRAGCRVPEDAGFVAILSTGKDAQATLTDHDPAEMGRTSVDQLDVLLRANAYGVPARAFTHLLESSWVEGKTLPVRRAATA